MRSLNPVTKNGMKDGLEGCVVKCRNPVAGEAAQNPTTGTAMAWARAREHSP